MVGIGIDKASEAEADVIHGRAVRRLEDARPTVRSQIDTGVSAEVDPIGAVAVDCVTGNIGVGNRIDENPVAVVVADVVAYDRRARRF